MSTSEPDYVVIRGLNPSVDGKWYDRSQMTAHYVANGEWCELVPTGEFETRIDDLAVAEVWAPEGWTP